MIIEASLKEEAQLDEEDKGQAGNLPTSFVKRDKIKFM